MSEIDKIQHRYGKQPRPLKTSAELAAILGTEHGPCPGCGTIRFVVTQYGDVICPTCKPGNYPVAYRVVVAAGPCGRPVLRDEEEELRRLEQLRRDKEALAWQLANQDAVDQWWEDAVEPMTEAEKMLARAASLFGARPSKTAGANNIGGNGCAADEKSRPRDSTSQNGSVRNAQTRDQQQKLF